MTTHEQLIQSFYEAFQRGDYKAMGECYHAQATFKDPAFDLKSGAEAAGMWKFLLMSSRGGLKIEFGQIRTEGNLVKAHWEAHYNFSKTGRQVHNIIDATFSFREGKIATHHDTFDFWRWSRQALGLPGLLLGWTPFLQGKVSQTAMAGLRKFMQAQK